MKIDEIRTGILVMISNLIEGEIDGIKRRKGAIGMVEAPVLGTGGMWWWVTHQDGSQIKYRYCEISDMKAVKVPESESLQEERDLEREMEIEEHKRNTVENWIC